MHAKSLGLLEHVREILQAYDFAITLRQLYYQLVAKQVIPNRQKYYMMLSRLCVIGRDEGILPEDAFADRLRQVDKWSSYFDLNDFMDSVKQAYTNEAGATAEGLGQVEMTFKNPSRCLLAGILFCRRGLLYGGRMVSCLFPFSASWASKWCLAVKSMSVLQGEPTMRPMVLFG